MLLSWDGNWGPLGDLSPVTEAATTLGELSKQQYLMMCYQAQEMYHTIFSLCGLEFSDIFAENSMLTQVGNFSTLE
jgi:hypothetical protein